MAPPALVGIPYNVTVRAGDAAVDLSWGLVNGAQLYRVEWEADPTLLALPVPLLANGAVDHEPLKSTDNIRYRYTVAVGSQSIRLSAIPRAPATNAPATVSIQPGLRENTLSWAPVSGTSTYRIYWSFFPNVSALSGAQIVVDGSQTNYTHEGLEPGTPYYYVITALVPGSGESGGSVEVQATPGQAAAVTATVSEGHVTIGWAGQLPAFITAATSRVMAVFPSPAIPIGGVESDRRPLVPIGGLENNRRHAFWVRPIFPSGLGPASSIVYAVPKAPSDGVPLWVELAAGRGTNELAWDAVDGATTYDVTWFGQNVTGNSSGTRTVTGTTFRHTGLETCAEFGDTCPLYTYLVRVAQSTGIAAEVGMQSVDLGPVPPMITNRDVVLITGLKPAGSRVEINGAVAVPFDYESGWTFTLALPAVTDPVVTFTFRLVAINADGLVSTETIYQVTRDTDDPTPPSVILTACDPPASSPRNITLSGTKDPDSTVFRAMEPDAPDQAIAGATGQAAWSSVLRLDDSPDTIELVAKDAAGNVSAPPISVSLSACP